MKASIPELEGLDTLPWELAATIIPRTVVVAVQLMWRRRRRGYFLASSPKAVAVEGPQAPVTIVSQKGPGEAPLRPFQKGRGGHGSQGKERAGRGHLARSQASLAGLSWIKLPRWSWQTGS